VDGLNRNSIDIKQREWHVNKYQKMLEEGISAYDGLINPDSIWYWFHTYCIDHFKEFFQNIPPSTFLTLGDGYCGREAIHIKRLNNLHKVHASDWQPCLIEVAHKMGLVDEFSSQDMGALTFEDNSFDFVFIKESLHHMSIPYIGLYEMLRVAKRGVILIEPSGDNESKYHFNDREPTGNYMYGFSSHELIKIGLAYGIANFAWTYSSVHFGRHNIDNITAGKVAEEKDRLIKLDNSIPLKDRPLLIFFFLKEDVLLDIFSDEAKFKRIRRIS
jgi:ubiquinone/menaquinone biosynthesis C-methylase UbiE